MVPQQEHVRPSQRRGKFIGLPLDDINEDDKTDTRIEAWIAAISTEL